MAAILSRPQCINSEVMILLDVILHSVWATPIDIFINTMLTQACTVLSHSMPNNIWIDEHIVKLLWPSDAIWRQISQSALAQVLACYLAAPNHTHTWKDGLYIETRPSFPEAETKWPTFRRRHIEVHFQNIRISISISPNFVPMGQINNISALGRIMAWCRSGEQILYEPMR